MRKAIANLRDLFWTGPPPAHYLERAKYDAVAPWHVRMFGASPFGGKGRGLFKTTVLVLLALGVTGGFITGFRIWHEAMIVEEFDSGIAALQAGDYPLAETRLRRSTELNPQNSQAFYELGNAYSYLGKEAEANRAWTEAARLEPTMGRAYIARGMEAFRKGDFAASLEEFNQAVSVQPSMESYTQQGLALQALGRHREAIESLNEASRHSDHPDALSISSARAISEKALKEEKAPKSAKTKSTKASKPRTRKTTKKSNRKTK